MSIFREFYNMEVDYQQELRRKTFHVSAIILPITYFFVPKLIMIVIMMIITSCTIYIDKARHTNLLIQELVDKFFKNLMREKELSGSFAFSGTSYMMAGFFITALFFPKGVTLASWLILIVSDSLAALVGKKMGIPRSNGKSLEGSAAFFVSSLMIGLLSYSFAHYQGGFMGLVLACLATTYVEYYSARIGVDDNLTIPITFSTIMTILGWIL